MTVNVVRVGRIKQLSDVRAMVIPSELTTIGSLVNRAKLLNALRGRIIDGLLTFGTYAGVIFIAKDRDSVVGEATNTWCYGYNRVGMPSVSKGTPSR